MLGSLRSKLILSYVAIIFLCLFLAGSAFLYQLRSYQSQLALNRLADLALPVSFQVEMLDAVGTPRSQIASFLDDLAQQISLRILLVDDQGQVVEDTGENLRGKYIEAPLWRGRLRGGISGVYHGREGDFYLVVAPSRSQPGLAGHLFERGSSYSVILAVPQQSIASAWLELAPSLSLAALISLVVSIAVALLLSRSILEPIRRVTRASEEMARGKYDQMIPVRGRDEVGRLATAFNAMAREVGRSQRLLRDFLANVSHELRTPLTSIQGFSQAILDGAAADGESTQRAAHIINEEAERMSHLVEDLLYLSKIEAGQLAMDRQPLDLADLLRAGVRRAQWRAQEAGIQLVLRTSPLPPVVGDAHWLEQVFENLLDNALKHTPTGGAITVSATIVTGERVAVRVHNTGSYVPPEELPKIFDRFYQVKASASKNSTTGGTGLGLAIVKEILQAHGGTVAAASHPADGTAFTVTLPAGETKI